MRCQMSEGTTEPARRQIMGLEAGWHATCRADKPVQEGERITMVNRRGILSAFGRDSVRGRFGLKIRSWEGVGLEIRSKESHSGEVVSCSFHIII